MSRLHSYPLQEVLQVALIRFRFPLERLELGSEGFHVVQGRFLGRL
jgi:hypothetical protein